MSKAYLRKTSPLTFLSHSPQSAEFKPPAKSRQFEQETAGWQPPPISRPTEHYLSHSIQTKPKNCGSQQTEVTP